MFEDHLAISSGYFDYLVPDTGVVLGIKRMYHIEGFVRNVAIMLKVEASGLSKKSESDIG
jgi:hypothetical protein